jgi:lipopolysaccharide export LptBFGC system permease protein LptF
LLTFLTLQLLRLSDLLIVHHVPFRTVIKIGGCLVISFIHFVLPTSFLAAVLIGFGRLSSDSEYTALLASGVSVHRMFRSVFLLAVAVSGVVLLTSLELAPWGERQMKRLLTSSTSLRVSRMVSEKQFNRDFFGLLIYADSVDSEEQTMSDVFLVDERDRERPMVVVARKGEIRQVGEPKADEPSRHIALKLISGTILPNVQNLRPPTVGKPTEAIATQTAAAGSSRGIQRTATVLEGEVPTDSEKIAFEEYTLNLELPEPGPGAGEGPRSGSLADLQRWMREAPPGSLNYLDCETEIWKRIALGLSPLVFAFMGVGLGVSRVRSAGSRGFLMTVLVSAVYWQVLGFSTGLGVLGKLPPPLALQIPTFGMGALGVLLYWRVARR